MDVQRLIIVFAVGPVLVGAQIECDIEEVDLDEVGGDGYLQAILLEEFDDVFLHAVHLRSWQGFRQAESVISVEAKVDVGKEVLHLAEEVDTNKLADLRAVI